MIHRDDAFAGSLAGLGLALILIDPAGGRLIAAFRYGQEQMSQRLSILGLVEKVVQLLAVQIVACFVAAGALFAGLFEKGRQFVLPFLAISALLAGGLGMTVTMGIATLVGHQALPFLIVVPLLVLLVLGDEVRGLRLVALLFPFCLIVPHVGNMVGSSVRANSLRHLALIDSGPLSDYIAYDWDFLSELRENGSLSRSSIDELADSFLEKGAIDNGVEYSMFARGLDELHEIPGSEALGIVTNGRMFDFSFALGAPPVLAFPAFPETGSPELRSDTPLGPEVDLVMIADFENHGMVTDQLFVKMADLYALCRRSHPWRIYARKGKGIEGCSSGSAEHSSD